MRTDDDTGPPEQAAAREEACRSLAECFFAPGVELESTAFFPSLQKVCDCLDATLGQRVRALARAFAEEGPAAIAADHQRMFSQRALTGPLAHDWLESTPAAWLHANNRLAAFYAQAGFVVEPGFDGPPDHVAVELEFLYLLIHHENQAVKCADSAALQSVLGWRDVFLGDHLARWLPAYLRSLEVNAQTRFYRALASATDCFLGLELRRSAGVMLH